MTRKLFRTGNSTVVSLPVDVLETVGLRPGDEVTVTVDPEQRRIIVTPPAPTLPGVRPDFLDQVDQFIERYQPALETLAQT
jgi:putative addiction module antidote